MRISDLVAIERTTGAEVKFLGALAWYTLPDMRVSREQLAERLVEHGLGDMVERLPRPTHPRDALRRASRAGEEEKIPYQDGLFVNLMIREVRNDRETLVRQLVREVVDSKNVKLTHLPVASFTLRDENLDVGYLAPLTEAEQKAVDAVLAAFEEAKTYLEGYHVRGLVTEVLHTMNPVAVRPSGGVYFVPAQYDERLESLKAFIVSLAEYAVTDNRPAMWSVPVIDLEEHRRMVKESLEDQVRLESQRLIEDMAEIVKSGRRIRTATAQKFIARVRELRQLVEQYKEMLQEKEIAATSYLELAATQAMELLTRVETEDAA